VRPTRLLALPLACVLFAGVACREQAAAPVDPLLRAYDVEADWNDPKHIIPMNYQQAQGKRLFYTYCVWCHADSTPAGPSNRSNLTPTPLLMNDGSVLNAASNEYLTNLIGLGGSALGKSSMMPPYGQTLKKDEIQALIAYMRAIAEPPYSPRAKPAPSQVR
jgi:mono/diheme cytochrome c family protein